MKVLQSAGEKMFEDFMERVDLPLRDEFPEKSI